MNFLHNIITQIKHTGIVPFCVMLILVSACKHESCINYNSFPEIVKNEKIEVVASLAACLDKDHLLLNLRIQNNSDDSIDVDYFNCTLSIDNERESLPESGKTFKNRLSPGEVENYELIYHPVNSLAFYNRINYRGDLKKKYSLNLNFIQNDKKPIMHEEDITFIMGNTLYQTYLNKYAKENKIEMFDIISDYSLINDQKKHLKDIDLPEELSDSMVIVSNSDIIFKNRTIIFSSYRQEDTLFLNIRLLNYGANKLKAMLNKLNIKIEGQTYFPVSINSEFFSYNEVIDSSVIIKRGARLSLLLKYKIPEKLNQYTLNSDWLLISDKKTFLSKDIIFGKFL